MINEKTLIGVVTYNRLEMSKKCIASVINTVDIEKHSLYLIDNASTDGTIEWLKELKLAYPSINLIFSETNIGTARGLNLAWKLKEKNQACLKIDNDMVFNTQKWLDYCLDVLNYDFTIGICALKRKDLTESPVSTNNWYKTKCFTIKQYMVEEANHTIGSCWVVNPNLINVIGALRQPTLYGFDDALYCHRAHIAGFKTVFLPNIDIDHIDPGNCEYTKVKQATASKDMQEYNKMLYEYINKKRPVYEDFNY